MSVYTSRNQPRRQTTIAGKIKDVERYDRYYDIAYDALQNRIFPRTTLQVGRLVVRTLKGPYDARGIPPGSSMSTSNRFSGSRLDGRPGQGALYVGTVTGVLREYTHYSLPAAPTKPAQIWKPSVVDATAVFMQGQRGGATPVDPKTKFYLFRVNQTLHFADLRLTSLAPFMTQLRRSGARRYGIDSGAPVDFLAMAASGPDDYSASRGIADAVFDLRRVTGITGVCAYSSRADRDSGLVASSDGDPTGGLVYAIFGADLSVVTALTPVPKAHDQVAFDTFAELNVAVRP
jgi:hypothetical protein